MKSLICFSAAWFGLGLYATILQYKANSPIYESTFKCELIRFRNSVFIGAVFGPPVLTCMYTYQSLKFLKKFVKKYINFY